ncbi:MAG: molybdate ABC transporter substrate-binding protein [Paracoccaceae bacterium]
MRLLIAFLLCLHPGALHAETALVAVATNFLPAAEVLAADYSAASGNDIRLTSGSTGKLAAQIMAAAPYDAFLSADEETPDTLAETDHAIAGSQFVYGIGQLVLWSADATMDLSDPSEALRTARHVAIANPKLAPYGKAASQCIEHMNLSSEIADRIVTGENIGQTHSLVVSGAAELGFVAASGLIGATGSAWPVPADCHAPIEQVAILLPHGAENTAARGFLDYLRTDPARIVIRSFGYGTAP